MRCWSKIIVVFLLTCWAHTTFANTECASGVFADALYSAANQVSESDSEDVIQQWIYDVFSDKSVLSQVLNCSEIKNVADDESITFMPIQYVFPAGREVIINYETQPKVLKQRILMANRRDVSLLNNPSPRIGASGDTAMWVNTDPAWYGIMVVQSGALDEFVGPDKNNTISLDYIKNNIDALYPRGAKCTSKSALARDNNAINRAVTQTVGLGDKTGEKDTNDYYVAGDVNLQWISYAEIALDVAITVATMGGGAIIAGTSKATRAARALDTMRDSLRTLSATPDVVQYVRTTNRITKLTDDITDTTKRIDELRQTLRALENTADNANEIENIQQTIRTMEQTIAGNTSEIAELRKTVQSLESTDDVKQYKNTSESFTELNKWRRELRALRRPQTGNVIARAARSFRAAMNGGDTIARGAKIARASMKSGKIRDWLFHSTLKNIGILGKIETTTGALYGAIKFIGGMYDYTETSTGDYTSGIEFAPLLLLSADDLSGQENVVNYGMWLLWAGDSTSAADDDAAFLQAMDFAAKFHQDLSELQNDTDAPCDVDIFVVRPVLRNPDTDNGQIYYLIMNDQPWTTAND